MRQNHSGAAGSQDWSWVTAGMFEDALNEIIEERGWEEVPGVMELLREHYNNEVLERLAEAHGVCQLTGLPYEQELGDDDD